MGKAQVFGPAAVSVRLAPGPLRSEPDQVKPGDEVAAVRTLLNQLFDAQQTFKNQTAQDLRDKLNGLREKLGDEKFKGILSALSDEVSGDYLEFLKKLLKLLFPDDEGVTPPSPPSPGGGGRRVFRPQRADE